MMIDFNLLYNSWPLLLSGTITSLQIAAASCALGLSLGIVLEIIESGTHKLLKLLVMVYLTIIRGTPMLIQISFWYFAFRLNPLLAAILGIGLNSAAYVSQIMKAGRSSVGKGQIEAAQVLGFTHFQTLRFIVLPQAIRTVLPALGNEFITLIKDSSLASTIGVVELYRQASYLRGRTYDVITPYAAMAVIYLVLTSSLSFCIRYIERKMKPHAKD